MHKLWTHLKLPERTQHTNICCPCAWLCSHVSLPCMRPPNQSKILKLDLRAVSVEKLSHNWPTVRSVNTTAQTSSCSLAASQAGLEEVTHSGHAVWWRFYLLAPLLQVALSRQRGHGAGSAWEILPCPAMKGLGVWWMRNGDWTKKKNQDVKTKKWKKKQQKLQIKKQWNVKEMKKDAAFWEKMEGGTETPSPSHPPTLRTSELLGSVVQVMMRETARRVSLELTKSVGSIWRASASM